MATQNQFAYPLYGFAVGWFNRQPSDPLSFIAPDLAVDGITGTYKRYPKGYAFRRANTKRALLTPATSIAVEAEDIPYSLEDHMLRIGVDDAEIKPGAGSKAEAAEQLAMSKTQTLLSVWRTSRIADGFDFFRAAVPEKQAKWSEATSDPVAELLEQIRDFRLENGVTPNRLLFSHEAWDVLAENAEVLSRVAFNDAQVLTPDLLLKLLGLRGSDTQIELHTIPVNDNLVGPGVPFSGKNVLGKELWMTYVDTASQIGNMCGMRTLHMGGETPVESVESYYERGSHATWYEVGLHRQFAVTAPSCNLRFSIS